MARLTPEQRADARNLQPGWCGNYAGTAQKDLAIRALLEAEADLAEALRLLKNAEDWASMIENDDDRMPFDERLALQLFLARMEDTK